MHEHIRDQNIRVRLEEFFEFELEETMWGTLVFEMIGRDSCEEFT